MNFREWLLTENVNASPYLTAILERLYDRSTWSALADHLQEEGDEAQQELGKYIVSSLNHHDEPSATTTSHDHERIFRNLIDLPDYHFTSGKHSEFFTVGVYYVAYVVETPRSKRPAFAIIEVRGDNPLRTVTMPANNLRWRNPPENSKWKEIAPSTLTPQQCDAVILLLAKQVITNFFINSNPEVRKRGRGWETRASSHQIQTMLWALGHSQIPFTNPRQWRDHWLRIIASDRKTLQRFSGMKIIWTREEVEKQREDARQSFARVTGACEMFPEVCQGIEEIFETALGMI